MLTLYTYFRSSAAFRVRIALALKGLAHDSAFIHLVRDGGQHRSAAYRAINPQQLVPALRTGNAPACRVLPASSGQRLASSGTGRGSA